MIAPHFDVSSVMQSEPAPMVYEPAPLYPAQKQHEKKNIATLNDFGARELFAGLKLDLLPLAEAQQQQQKRRKTPAPQTGKLSIVSFGQTDPVEHTTPTPRKEVPSINLDAKKEQNQIQPQQEPPKKPEVKMPTVIEDPMEYPRQYSELLDAYSYVY